MAAPVGSENRALALEEIRERLFDEPYSFSFFQAVRLLERMQPERSAVGRYSQPEDECVRFASHSTLSFPASEIQALAPSEYGPPKMTVNFMGLTGPISALPIFMTELVAARLRLKDNALRDFLDLFNHRLISFFYQAWLKHHSHIAYERDRSDPLTKALMSIVGLGTEGLRDRQVIRDESLIYYAGLIGPVQKSAAALEALLSDYFNVPVEVVPFVGTWRKLGHTDQCVFGDDSESTELGIGVIVGDEVWDQNSRLRLRIGPLTIQQYRDFLPNGSACPALRALTRLYSGNDWEFEVQLVLRSEDVPSLLVGEEDDAVGPQLGWSTWLKSGVSTGRDRDETLFILTEE